MAVRINKAKNFKGKAYVAADELDNLIQSMTFANTGDAITHAGGNADNDWMLTFTTADGNVEHTSSVDLTRIKDYIDNKSITVTAGNGIAIDSTNALSPTIAADIDLKAVTTESGYAATYQLFVKNNAPASDTVAHEGDVNGYKAIGAKINIVKDNLVKEGTLVYNASASPSYGANGLMTGESATKIDNGYAFVKLTLNTNTNGDATDNETVTYLYIPVNDLFHDKTAGNGIDATALNSNIIQVVVDGANVVYTATATTGASILTVDSTGIHVADIQGAINYAVKNEHEKASAAITSTNANITSLANATSTAVTALNTRIEAVATSAQAGIQKVGSAVDILDTQVSAAIADVNTNVETAINSVVTNANAAINTNITNINTSVAAAIATVNSKVGSAVDSVNTKVKSLADLTSTTVNAINTNITAFEATVSASVTSTNTALGTAVTETNTAITSVVTNVNTALGTGAANITDARAVTVLEETKTPDLKSGTTGEYETTVTAKYIIAVFGATTGDQIYPDIVRGAAGTGADVGKYTYTLTADYGVAQDPVEQWKVICANNVVAVEAPTAVTAPAPGNTVAYEDATNSVAYTNADKGTDASYTNVTKTDVTDVNMTDVDWSDVADVKATAVGNGTVATAPTAPTEIVKDAPDYAGYAD